MAKPHKMPMQPVAVDTKGVTRFVPNRVVRYLLDNGGIDMNHLATLHLFRDAFTKEEMAQFAQLIGYSTDGFCELSYTGRRQWRMADARAAKAKKEPD